MDTMRIDLCVNDPNNGNPTGKLEAIHFDDILQLESNLLPNPNVVCRRTDDNTIKIGRRKFPIFGYGFWIGNWCWDGITVSVDVANAILAYVHSLRWHGLHKFGVDEGDTEAFLAYQRGDKIDLRDYMDEDTDG